MMKVAVQPNVLLVEPGPELVAERRQNIQLALCGGQNVRVWLTVLEPDSIFMDIQDLTLVLREPQFCSALKIGHGLNLRESFKCCFRRITVEINLQLVDQLRRQLGEISPAFGRDQYPFCARVQRDP